MYLSIYPFFPEISSGNRLQQMGSGAVGHCSMTRCIEKGHFTGNRRSFAVGEAIGRPKCVEWVGTFCKPHSHDVKRRIGTISYFVWSISRDTVWWFVWNGVDMDDIEKKNCVWCGLAELEKRDGLGVCCLFGFHLRNACCFDNCA